VKNQSSTYLQSGVDIDKAEKFTQNIKKLVSKTERKEQIGSIGGFGALFEIPKNYRRPVLVSGTDGVGTKLMLAYLSGMHKVVGLDLVAMSVNDIAVLGAEPLYFLDYYACGSLSLAVASDVMSGIAEGCKQAGCALIGGETAEMPGLYAKNEYDLAGFAVGIVEKDQIIDGGNICSGDIILGLPSNGLHSNGFSLARLILEEAFGNSYLEKSNDLILNSTGKSLFSSLMTPTRIYVGVLRELIKKHFSKIHGIAHITGGGMVKNIPRILPRNLRACIEKKAWPKLELMDWLVTQGNIEEKEFYSVFNAGIGMILVVDANEVKQILKTLESFGEDVYVMGKVEDRQSKDSQIEIF
tara:strand:- start:33380 stop:34444 length:1065 start_codon:yes stop_codon:yes gene_type:complete